MKRAVIITDLTQMSGQRVCIAGYFEDLKCVRPIDLYQRINKEWIVESHEVIIHPFAIVEFIFGDRKIVQKPHTEDLPISINYRVKLGELELAKREKLLLNIDDIAVKNIFKAPICRGPGCYIKLGEGERSLGTICNPEILRVYFGSWYGKQGYRLTFKDNEEEIYELTVTDLTFRYFINYLNKLHNGDHQVVAQWMLKKLQDANVYLRIGLARGWDSDPSKPQDKCFLQITGVYSFPDYLSGNTFLKLDRMAGQVEGI